MQKFVGAGYHILSYSVMVLEKPPAYMTYWNQQDDVQSYLCVTHLPALTELTACLYFEPSDDDPIDALRSDGRGRHQHLISIAYTSKSCLRVHETAFDIWALTSVNRI